MLHPWCTQAAYRYPGVTSSPTLALRAQAGASSYERPTSGTENDNAPGRNTTMPLSYRKTGHCKTGHCKTGYCKTGDTSASALRSRSEPWKSPLSAARVIA